MKGKDEIEVRRLEARLKERRSQVESLRSRAQDQQSRLAKEQGEILGSLGDLPETMAELESRLMSLDERAKALELDRRAAALAAGIFTKVSEDSGDILSSLAEELSKQFGQIVPGIRDVRLAEISSDAISLEDAGGSFRPLSDLSTGTRDAFLLAARLTMARRGHDGQGLLILDEPFHNLDEERIERALLMLKIFQENTGWQIVIFSKDPRSEVMARSSFQTCQIHNL
jgi:DNA repair exonuclease SbcCD ATPase subunit